MTTPNLLSSSSTASDADVAVATPTAPVTGKAGKSRAPRSGKTAVAKAVDTLAQGKSAALTGKAGAGKAAKAAGAKGAVKADALAGAAKIDKPAKSAAPKAADKSGKAAKADGRSPGKQGKAAKPAGKGSDAPAAKLTPKPTPKPVKPARDKLVRDSFTLPAADFALIGALKARALTFARPTKKSELLRAGLQVLQSLDDAALQQALARLVPLKTGRPKKSD